MLNINNSVAFALRSRIRLMPDDKMRDQIFVSLIAFIFFMPVVQAQYQPVHVFDWKIAGTLPDHQEGKPALGLAGPVAGMHHQKLIIAGGANFPDSMPWAGGKKKYYADIYVYSHSDDTLLIMATGKLPFPVAYAASCTTTDGILLAGGENEMGIHNKALLISWDPVREKIAVTHLPDLPIAVTNASAIAINNVIFVAGGEMQDGVSDQFFSLDLNIPGSTWKCLPSVPVNVSHAVLVAIQEGKDAVLYLAGGRKKTSGGISELYRSFYCYDLKRTAWSAKKPLPWALSAGTGIAYGKHYIFLFGGDKGATFHQAEQLIAAAAKEKNEKKKAQLNRQRVQVQSLHPGFSNEILQYGILTDRWTVEGRIPFDGPVTTIAISSADSVIIPSGEIRAGIRSPRILKGKIQKAR